ncbi:hypothetical protein L1286_13075 [Pseudoalteromonas sp. SMS1]|uniref:hypothetical protein n=1 Tax=Pseudoalteromonas sp. SMS1 TaxID=2908894 RepID=UPI001F1F619C|nr:hypothetical protein [Pseudoalteromonas sp. SMS1]MCF2858414.1 hypothetical protein [Pseudoalteromonas sp. SMS1]
MKIKALSIIALTATIIACGSDSYDPDLPEPRQGATTIIATGFNVQIYQRAQNSGISLDRIARGTEYIANERVAFDSVIIGIDTQTEYVNPLSKQRRVRPFSFINTAYALSPVPPTVKQKIKAITITSAYDLNDKYPAGHTLNDVFVVTTASIGNHFYDYDADKRVYLTVSEYVESNTQNEAAHTGFALDLMLNTAPTLASSMTFYIEIALDDGKVFSLETPEITYQGTQ